MTTWIGSGVAPSLDSIELIGSLIRVFFDEDMDNNTALQSASSYTITPLTGGVSVTVLLATPGLGNTNYVDLTLDRYMTLGANYELAVNPLLEDVAGNTMNPAGLTLQFAGLAPGTVSTPTTTDISILDRMGDSSASFINGLSDLWLRFFKDRNQLEAMYDGEAVLLGQAYMELLDTVLNLSLTETPIYNRDYFKLITIREDQVSYDTSISRYVFDLPNNIKNFQVLCNKVYAPTAILEKDTDFEIDISGEQDELRFLLDPFDWSGADDTIPGFATRVVEVESGSSIVEYRQISIWVPDAEIDKFNLYTSYGHLITSFSPSSEAYRALLLGISRYFILGPTLAHIRSALAVSSGFDVVRDDGEILQSVDQTDTLTNTVVTDKRSYVYAKNVPLRTDVLDPLNWGTLTFEAYETLTNVYVVKDSISDPTWWHNITIPEELTWNQITGAVESLSRRSINPYLTTPVYGEQGLFFGDPGLFFGCDEDGFDPAAAGLARKPLRHNWAYLVFDQFLKHHVFAVTLNDGIVNNTDFEFPVWDEQIIEIVMAGKPSYVFFYAGVTTYFDDQVGATDDELDIKVMPTLPDNLSAVNNGVQFGIRSAKYGDYYTLGAGDSVAVYNESVDGAYDRTLGENPVCFGGVDPTHRKHYVASDVSGANLAIIAQYFPTGEMRVVVSNDAFHPDDVGRYFEDYTTGVIGQITTFVSAKEVRFVTDLYVGGSGLSWYVWNDHAAGHDKSSDGGMADWPLSITIS